MTKSDLKKIRDSKGMSQKEFGEWLGYSEGHISKFERGVMTIPKPLRLALTKSNKVEIPSDLKFISDVYKHGREKDISTFEEALYDLVKATGKLGVLVALGYFAYQNPEGTKAVAAGVLSFIGDVVGML